MKLVCVGLLQDAPSPRDMLAYVEWRSHFITYVKTRAWRIHVTSPVCSCFPPPPPIFWSFCKPYVSYSTKPGPFTEHAFYSDDIWYTSREHNFESFDIASWDTGVLISCSFLFNTQNIEGRHKFCMCRHKTKHNTTQYPYKKYFITVFYCMCLCLYASSRQTWITAISEGSL
jgi:hypothetical protein